MGTDDDDEPRAWVLNLDADLELAAHPRAYTPPASLRARGDAMARVLAPLLLGPRDVVVSEDERARGAARGLPGRAYSPTPSALRLLARAGAIAEPHPSVDVLRRVSSRAFAAELGATLPGEGLFTDAARARAKLRETPPVGDAWRMKRAFGMSGRGQRVVVPGTESDADRSMIESAIAEGGVRIEPSVAIVTEYGMHALLPAGGGALRVGALVRQTCDARGAWLATERVTEPEPNEVAIGAALAAEIARVGAALEAAGYFGPFGVDAFTYRDARGDIALQPRSEINARYSMGFGVGFGRAARARAV